MADELMVQIATPEKMVFSDKVEEVTIPGVDGEFGVLFGHAPLLTLVNIGELDYTKDNKKTHYAIGAGYVEVTFQKVTLLLDSAERSDEIDKEIAHAQLAEKAYPKDWRWQWVHVKPLHYLKCPVYSQLASKPAPVSGESSTERATQEMIEVKPEFMGMSLNIKVLLTRLANWWLSKRKH